MNAPSSPAPAEFRSDLGNSTAVDPPSTLPRRLSVPVSWPWFRGTGRRARSEGQAARVRPTPVFALARPRRMKGRTRSVLLWSLSFYALAVLVLNVIMDRWCPAPFEGLYRIKWEQLQQFAETSTGRPLVVMLGSSRTDGAFKAGRLDGMPGPDGRPLAAYNFGIPAAGPMHEYQYLLDMLEHGIRPRLLLVEFLPPLFTEPHSHLISEENWVAPDWMSMHQFVRMHPYFARPVRKISEWVEARLAPWYVHRFSLNSWLVEQIYPPPERHPVPYYHDECGCRCPESVTPEVRAARWLTARDYIPTLNHFRLSKGPTQAMRDLLACCRREQVPVVLVLTPESATFRSWYRPNCLAAMRDLLAELRATYGVEVIDARQWLDDDDFMDGHHLDTSGAEKFTTRMIAEVQRILR